MSSEWLDGQTLADWLDQQPPELCDLIITLRDLVQDTIDNVEESIHYGSLCYTKPNQPYGMFGGNVCGIGVKHGVVQLGFIHGAFLPDPHGLLEGTGKSKRHISIASTRDIKRREFKALMRASMAYTPDGQEIN